MQGKNFSHEMAKDCHPANFETQQARPDLGKPERDNRIPSVVFPSSDARSSLDALHLVEIRVPIEIKAREETVNGSKFVPVTSPDLARAAQT